jgi:transcriptional regulator with XRE-family HTH domain
MDINLKLKFRIIERYRTQSRFAVCCGKNDNWISRLIQGRQLPTLEEKRQIQTKLQIKPENIDSYFGGIEKK